MKTISVTEFSGMARRLSVAAHREGLNAPGFRSPPKSPGRRRTLRRFPDGVVLVSVATSGRAADSVLSDMIDGVLVANRLTGAAGERARNLLLEHVSEWPSRAA